MNILHKLKPRKRITRREIVEEHNTITKQHRWRIDTCYYLQNHDGTLTPEQHPLDNGPYRMPLWNSYDGILHFDTKQEAETYLRKIEIRNAWQDT